MVSWGAVPSTKFDSRFVIDNREKLNSICDCARFYVNRDFGRKSNPCPRNSGKNPARGPPKSAQGRRPRADFGGQRAGFFPAIRRYEGLDFSIII